MLKSRKDNVMRDTRHQCRWCSNLTTGNGIYCGAKQKCLSESYTKRVNRCKLFEFCDIDAYSFKVYKPRAIRSEEINGQMSFAERIM